MSLSLPQIATYISYLFIIIVYTVKVVKIARMPPHLRWELYPVPHERGYKHGGSYFEELEWWTKPRQRNRARSIFFKIRDYFTFPGYYRRNKGYWIGLYPWHIGFYAIVSFHILSFIGALVTVISGIAIGANSTNSGGQIIYYLTLLMAVAGFVLGSVGSIVLLSKRLIDRDFRTYASASNYFNYLFFLLVFLSGLISWYFFDLSLTSYREFWQSLIAFKYINVEPATYAHIMLFSLFLMYLPFTRSTHYITKIIAFFGVLWDDSPDLSRRATEKNLKEVLGKPVSWSASHIQAGKSWGEAVEKMPEDTTGIVKQ